MLVLLLVIGSFMYLYEEKYENQRREGVLKLCKSNNYEFFAADNGALLECYKNYEFSKKGNSGEIKNVVKVMNGEETVTLFEYKYTISGGRSSSTHYDTVVLLPAKDVPDFLLKPEGIHHKLYSLFGYQDFDFDSHPRFSDNYVLKAENELQVRVFFEKGALDYLDVAQGNQIQVKNELVAIVFTERQPPQQYLDRIHSACSIWKGICGAPGSLTV